MKLGCFSISILLFILFLGLKLGEVGQVATWSWWWVTAPLWIFAVTFATLFVVFSVIISAAAIISIWAEKK